jgi:hypothetical protein
VDDGRRPYLLSSDQAVCELPDHGKQGRSTLTRSRKYATEGCWKFGFERGKGHRGRFHYGLERIG